MSRDRRLPRATPHRPFIPDPAQMALRPEVSGNTVNGLGETEPRRPSMVYWAPDPDTIPHGAMQRWFYTVDPGDPRFDAARAERHAMAAAPPAPLAPERADRSPEDWTAALARFPRAGLCEKTGVARMRPDWVYDHAEVPERTVLVFGVQHDYDEISRAPHSDAGAEVMAQYNRAARVAIEAANWLRAQGWPARPVTGPMTGEITLIPPALEAGFGELGKHGSLIDREMGASFRLSAVVTDAPFAPTPRAEHGIDAFCAACRVCEDACPPLAISPDKQTVRGVTRWYVDFDACLPFFNQTQGCAICIAVCPWSRPGTGPRLAEKLARRAARLTDEETGTDAAPT